MKGLLVALFILSMSSAFAGGQINQIECSGAPRFVGFKLRLNYNEGVFQGQGYENYATFNFVCQKSTDIKSMVCEASSPLNKAKVKVTINIDEDNVFTAKYEGIYSTNRNIKIGCIAGM